MTKHTVKPIKNAKVLTKRKGHAAGAPNWMVTGAATRGDTAKSRRAYKAGQWGTFGPASPCITLVSNGEPVKQEGST